MGIPAFLLRKLYKKGSLHQFGNEFTFQLYNPIGTATLTGPPEIVVNGMHYDAGQVTTSVEVDLADISKHNPFVFARGDTVDLTFAGHLLKGGNRIHFMVDTKEFDEVEFLVEDRISVPDGDEEE